MKALATITIFANALLLFLAEPIVAKMVLPYFGGSASVWTTCLFFFQLVLICGYLAAHALATRPRSQRFGYGFILLAAVISLPISLKLLPTTENHPIGQLLLTLLATIALPFFALCMGAPTVQSFYAGSNEKDAHNPYGLYAASNVGSLLALLIYPVLIEPHLNLSDQARLWSIGYGVLLVLAIAYAAISRATGGSVPAKSSDEAAEETPSALTGVPAEPSDSRERRKLIMLWVALAAAPSSLMMGVTTYLTTNIAPVPLLWVVPLALYLATFVVAFSNRKRFEAKQIGRWVPIVLTPLSVAVVLEASQPLLFLALFHLAAFTLVTLACHVRLSELKPAAKDLTAYFAWVSLGGLVGGTFNAIVAPMIFRTVFEYPVALAVGAALVASVHTKATLRLPRMIATAGGFLAITAFLSLVANRFGLPPGPIHTAAIIGLPAVGCFLLSGEPAYFGLALLGMFAGSALSHANAGGTEVFADRSFYGVSRIVDDPKSGIRSLVHGNTTHGKEFLDPLKRDIPLTYYTETGPLGEIFQARSFHNVGIIGLGVGSIASYSKPGDTFTYFEIDPIVKRVASDPKYFHFLWDAKGKVSVVLGDGRLSIAKAPDHSFDLIVLDAFSSDAIPTHLLTQEAIQLYRQKLRPGGWIAFHLSNNFLRLAPVVAKTCANCNLFVRYDSDDVIDPAEEASGKEASQWLVATGVESDFKVLSRHGDFEKVDPAPSGWTDGYSSLWEALKWNHREDQ